MFDNNLCNVFYCSKNVDFSRSCVNCNWNFVDFSKSCDWNVLWHCDLVAKFWKFYNTNYLLEMITCIASHWFVNLLKMRSLQYLLTDVCRKLMSTTFFQCYYIGGSATSATNILKIMSNPFKNHLPYVKICEKLKDADPQICDLKYGKAVVRSFWVSIWFSELTIACTLVYFHSFKQDLDLTKHSLVCS